MTIRIVILLIFLTLPIISHADENKDVDPLPCGIYDENAKAYVEKDLDTQSARARHYTMVTTTKSGKRLSVEIRYDSIKLVGERNHVSVFVDGVPYAKTSHQDLPVYLEVNIDGRKYRIICMRGDEFGTGLVFSGNDERKSNDISPFTAQ